MRTDSFDIQTMKKVFLFIAAVIGLGIATGFDAGAQEKDLDATYATQLLKPGTKAPDFQVTAPDGKTLKLSKFKGKTVVLDFWASWCGDCRRELPAVEAAYERFSKKGVVFIGVSFDDNKEKWTAAIDQFGLKYLQGSELKKWSDTEVSPLYNLKWIPTLYIIDKKGKVVLGTVMTEKMISRLEAMTEGK